MPPALRPATLPCLLAALVFPPAAFGADEALDSVMYADPEIPTARVVKVFPPRLIPLWLGALEGPEADLRCQAAAAIALGQRRGMPGLEATVPPLLRALDRADQHPTVRLAAAQALVALDARDAAPALLAHARSDGVEMRLTVEPALARWAYAPAGEDWLGRLARDGPPRRTVLLAVQGLGALREPRAVPPLLDLVRAPSTDPIVRLEAARTLGNLRNTGLAPEAERLAAEKSSPGSVARLAAAALLRWHRDVEAVRVLQGLAGGDDPAAAAAALDALTDADPRLALPLFPRLAASPDAAVRARAVEAYRRAPVPDHLTVAADLMDDPHPQVRVCARKAMLELARGPDQRPAVIREAARLLAADRWRGQEQAAIVLATLDDKPAAARFVELLRSDRPEVFVAAAWGLRRLAVPDTLPAQLAEVERRWQRSLKPDPVAPREAIDRQVAQLGQSLGRARYAPAGPVLARFVPKQWNVGPESRAAAIWALGLIHEAAPPARLIDGLLDRLTDDGTIAVEDLRVRRMAAISLGRMKADGAVESLRKYYPRKLTTEPFPNACGWALQRITGEPFPASGTAEVVQRGWFLEPID